MNRIENKGIGEIKKLCAKHGLSISELIMGLNVVPVRIYEVISGERRITPDTDLRLSKFFKLPEGYFCRLQLEHDLELAREKIRETLQKIKPVDEA